MQWSFYSIAFFLPVLKETTLMAMLYEFLNLVLKLHALFYVMAMVALIEIKFIQIASLQHHPYLCSFKQLPPNLHQDLSLRSIQESIVIKPLRWWNAWSFLRVRMVWGSRGRPSALWGVAFILLFFLITFFQLEFLIWGPSPRHQDRWWGRKWRGHWNSQNDR